MRVPRPLAPSPSQALAPDRSLRRLHRDPVRAARRIRGCPRRGRRRVGAADAHPHRRVVSGSAPYSPANTASMSSPRVHTIVSAPPHHHLPIRTSPSTPPHSPHPTPRTPSPRLLSTSRTPSHRSLVAEPAARPCLGRLEGRALRPAILPARRTLLPTGGPRAPDAEPAARRARARRRGLAVRLHAARLRARFLDY